MSGAGGADDDEDAEDDEDVEAFGFSMFRMASIRFTVALFGGAKASF